MERKSQPFRYYKISEDSLYLLNLFNGVLTKYFSEKNHFRENFVYICGILLPETHYLHIKHKNTDT